MTDEYRIPNQVAVRGWQVDFIDDLRAHLDALNADGVGEAVVLERADALVDGHTGMWLAYCTDPDGEWCIESGDPNDRVGDLYGYDPVRLDFIEGRGPFRVLDSRTLQLPLIEFDSSPESRLRAFYTAAERGEPFVLAGREYAPVGSNARWTPGVEP